LVPVAALLGICGVIEALVSPRTDLPEVLRYAIGAGLLLLAGAALWAAVERDAQRTAGRSTMTSGVWASTSSQAGTSPRSSSARNGDGGPAANPGGGALTTRTRAR
jgi:hypothetical protein